jgi:hypothetical protein
LDQFAYPALGRDGSTPKGNDKELTDLFLGGHAGQQGVDGIGLGTGRAKRRHAEEQGKR